MWREWVDVDSEQPGQQAREKEKRRVSIVCLIQHSLWNRSAKNIGCRSRFLCYMSALLLISVFLMETSWRACMRDCMSVILFGKYSTAHIHKQPYTIALKRLYSRLIHSTRSTQDMPHYSNSNILAANARVCACVNVASVYMCKNYQFMWVTSVF